ncbi:MAG: maltose alpha-D-glucosyltransferase [Paludisphaera borealis]|uniref:maltose alpha-D-glucosyltransferase n=1 Tax=Paludisphaera borealis TaxID=1387353 RepID=UPI00284AB8F4|nr:maltose alpha-D-glucosyltransferase [Paludisphaera borealis]MDR3623050.1 maltose alpha-D-glucosyltransferase [Paludisphaera borealis]
MRDDDGLWYKDAIIYEAHVRAFFDSNDDGVGDFRGLTLKLDYLRDLGVTAIWLLPFYPSPLRDDGYDIADYTKVNKQYGRLSDFREFLDTAHRLGMRVITELVLNHTSDQHEWFQRARTAPAGSPERDFYVWSDTPDLYPEARIIFKDFEVSNWTWDPVANAYFWHRFYSHQPDLNYDNPAVWEAVFPLVDFWFGMGVDGLRLDAVPYLYERPGTNCENLPETHEFLKALRKHVDEKFPTPPRMFLAEANQWPEDAVAYFGDDDECHMAFHFPVMPRLFMALHQEDRFPILDILAQTPAIPENSQWCMFLRNHDELTLEMVTDEERDSMYRAYAQDPEARINLGIRHRLAPLLYNDRRRIELMTALLFSLPGTPVLYYGDEIGMGDNIYLGDRNGVRTPMQWSPDRNAGFSNCNPQKLYFPVITDSEYHYEAVNVESQQQNTSSLLWWTKRMIALRKQYRAFGRGTLDFLRPENAKILVFVRSYEDERILVVANLSRFMQYVELDLREFQGCVPEELSGRSLLPPIDERPYRLTLSPYAFYWFLLKPADAAKPALDGEPLRVGDLPALTVADDWRTELCGKDHARLGVILPSFLERRRPPGVPRIVAAHITRSFADPMGSGDIQWLVVRVELDTGDTESSILPLTVIGEDDSSRLLESASTAVLARLTGNRTGLLCDAVAAPACGQELVQAIQAGMTAPLADGELAAVALKGLAEAVGDAQTLVPSHLIRGERFNATLVFDERLTLKTFRSVETEINPDFEIRTFLSARQEAPIVAPVLGYIEYRRVHGPPVTVAVLNQYIPNQGTAWHLTINQLSQFYERVAAHSHRRTSETPSDPNPAVPDPGAEASLEEIIGGFESIARKIGVQTALLHRTLASDSRAADFRPEPFGRLYQRSLYQAMRNLTHQVFTRLTFELPKLTEPVKADAARLLSLREPLLERFREVADTPLGGSRIRIHGDYELDQLVYTGTDFVVIDFEADLEDSTGERRVKRSPLRDVAAMIRSFDYAAHSVLFDLEHKEGRPPGLVRQEDRSALEPWARRWQSRISRQFVDAYFESLDRPGLLPATRSQCEFLLDVMLLERALDEVGRDMARRPDWMVVPLRALLRMLEPEAPPPSNEVLGV